MRKLLAVGCVVMLVVVAATGCRVVSPQVDAKVFLVRAPTGAYIAHPGRGRTPSVSVTETGVARAGFSEGLQQGIGGSMRVLGIRQQIEATLMWISGITSVILSVEGETEGILQP